MTLLSIMMWVFFISCVIPVSLTFWIISLRMNTLYANAYPISPWRYLVALLLPIYLAKHGMDRKSLDKTGALAALVVGFVMTMSNYCFCVALLTFFLTGSKITKFKAEKKKLIDTEYKEGGQRDWRQVVCNGGIATELAIIFMLDNGSREQLLDFQNQYTSTWLCLAVLSTIACNCGDTWASEIGSVFGSGQPRHILTLEKVPVGTNGGISLAGTVASFIGGLCVGLTYYITLVFTHTYRELEYAQAQWPVVIAGGMAGLIGSLIDSLLGATLQYSGYCSEKKGIVDVPSSTTRKISGIPMLDNNGVNLFSGLITALIMPDFCFSYWPKA
ncbi:transmembrane protein 19-like [Ptychodera flava]|uniref:transmembrane protein 19-like n=1 Tax=Ptychodera flava TaxID=63121 RepID=UPI00396AA053